VGWNRECGGDPRNHDDSTPHAPSPCSYVLAKDDKIFAGDPPNGISGQERAFADMATAGPAITGHRPGSARSGERLKSWKEIAAYFGTDERTVRRWEGQRGLPVHRVPGPRGTVYAERAELERWLHHEPAASAPAVSTPLTRRTLLATGTTLGLAGLAGYGWWETHGGAGPPANPLVERGMAATHLGTAESTAQAIDLLEDAVQQAPGDASAWGALAIAHAEAQYFIEDREAAATVAKSREAARRALALDPQSALAAAALAVMVPTYRNWPVAERALREVLRRQPDQFEARIGLSRLLANMGRIAEALETAWPLRSGQPLRPNVEYWIGSLLWQVGRLGDSDRMLAEALHRWPRNYMAWFTRYWQLLYTGQAGAALALAQATGSRPVGIPAWNFDLLQTTAKAVESRSAPDVRQAVDAHVAAARRGAGLAENAIEVSAYLGAVDQAFAIAEGYFLGRGFAVASTRYSDQQGSFTRPAHRETKGLFSPATAAMRRDKRFADLVRAIGLKPEGGAT
jgi:tetratricopeptide (TPR) repeat protein